MDVLKICYSILQILLLIIREAESVWKEDWGAIASGKK